MIQRAVPIAMVRCSVLLEHAVLFLSNATTLLMYFCTCPRVSLRAHIARAQGLNYYLCRTRSILKFRVLLVHSTDPRQAGLPRQ